MDELEAAVESGFERDEDAGAGLVVDLEVGESEDAVLGANDILGLGV